MKGAKYQEELVRAKKAIDTLGYKLINKEEYLLPSEQSKRCNLYFIRKDHGLKYPRNYAKIKNSRYKKGKNGKNYCYRNQKGGVGKQQPLLIYRPLLPT